MQTKDYNSTKLYISLDIHKRSWKIHTATDLFDGKTISCSLCKHYREALWEKDKIKAENTVVLTAFGSGFVWESVMIIGK